MLTNNCDTTTALIADFIATPVTIGESGCETWRLDDRDKKVQAYLKHGEGPLADAVADEMVRLRWMQARLPVPRVIQFVGNSDASWLISGAIQGMSARQKLEERKLSKHSIVDVLAAFMRRVHAVPQDQCPYDARLARRLIEARARIDAGAVDVDDFDEERQGWSAEDVWAALKSSEP
jgi:aminoglycoside 3'-phosphotransferase I